MSICLSASFVVWIRLRIVELGAGIANKTSILHRLRKQLKPGDALLISVDMCQDPTVLLSAYDDKNGITGAFHLNVLRRLNREFGYNFDVDKFRYLNDSL